MDSVVADSTFYIFFFDEIQCLEELHCIVAGYNVHVGSRIKKEINHHLKEHVHIKAKLVDLSGSIDFENILMQYQASLLAAFPKLQKWNNKGEFEAIGISYFLKESGNLKYLIIDDKKPFLFIKTQLRTIAGNLTRTFGFLIKAVDRDKILPVQLLVEIMNRTEKEIILGNKPINIDKTVWETEIKPMITQVTER